MYNSLIINKLKSEVSKHNLLAKEIDSVGKESYEIMSKLEVVLKEGEIDRNDIKSLIFQNMRFLMVSSEIQTTLAKISTIKQIIGDDWDSKENALSEDEKKGIEMLEKMSMDAFYIEKDELKMHEQFMIGFASESIDGKVPHDQEELRKIAESFIANKNNNNPETK